MANWKVIVRLRFQTAQWSEVFYGTTDDVNKMVNITDANRDAMMAARMPGTTLVAIQAVDVYNPRVGKTKPYNFRRFPLAPGELIGTGDIGPDVAATCAYCRIGAAAGPSRPYFYRGLRDAIVKRTESGDPDFSVWNNFHPGVLTWIKSSVPYQIRSYVPSSDPQARRFKVRTVTQLTGGRCRLGLAAADWPAFLAGQSLKFNGNLDGKVLIQGGSADKHNFPGLKGEFLVLEWDNAGFSVVVSYDLPFNITGPQEPQKMTIRNLRYNFNDITTMTPVDFRSRQTGLPTGLPRGRSRAVQSRH